MSDAGVRVIDLKARSRGQKMPTVLGRTVREVAWPIRHLDFTLAPGETVAVWDIRNNRPGLFLRLATGLVPPDEGRVSLPERSIMAAPPNRKMVRNLSVEQVIRMMAGLYGLSDRTIDRRFDDMVSFAGAERLLHRRIESQTRQTLGALAFAAATSAHVDLVAFDRTALVGDADFRAKCAARLAELKQSGNGLLLFTPNVRQIRSLADRGLVLNGEKSRILPVDDFATLVSDAKKGKLAERRRARKARRAKED